MKFEDYYQIAKRNIKCPYCNNTIKKYDIIVSMLKSCLNCFDLFCKSKDLYINKYYQDQLLKLKEEESNTKDVKTVTSTALLAVRDKIANLFKKEVQNPIFETTRYTRNLKCVKYAYFQLLCKVEFIQSVWNNSTNQYTHVPTIRKVPIISVSVVHKFAEGKYCYDKNGINIEHYAPSKYGGTYHYVHTNIPYSTVLVGQSYQYENASNYTLSEGSMENAASQLVEQYTRILNSMESYKDSREMIFNNNGRIKDPLYLQRYGVFV